MPDLAGLLGALRGAPTLVIICGLLFLEEGGLPIPLAPGEAVLIGSGLLIASGAEPFWVVLPATYLSALGGALTGFFWSRGIGVERVRGLAGRIGAEGGFDRVANRLGGAGPAGIGVSRLIPGLRIYTTLVAGAVGIKPRTFIAAVAPAIAVWVLAFTALGIFVGIPAQRLLGRFENLALRGAIVLVLLVAGYLVLRKVPAPRRFAGRPSGPTAPWRVAAAAGVDLLVVAVVMIGLGALSGLSAPYADSVISTVFLVGAFSLVYLAAARRSVGVTAGEAVFRVRYP